MFSPIRTLTACKLLLPFLICLHPTRVIAIYTKTTHSSSLGHGGCIKDVATLWQRWPPATTTWWPHPIYIILYIIYQVYVCHSSIVFYISRLSNVVPYPHLNSLLGLLAILDTSISYPYNCYLHTYHIAPLLGHWGRVIDVLYDNAGDLLLLHSGPYIYVTPVFSASRLFNVYQVSYTKIKIWRTYLVYVRVYTMFGFEK